MRWQKNGKIESYEPTDSDALDLARAVAREGAPRDAVAWTLVQRFAFLYPLYRTLSEFVRAYSQPINPRWFPDGDKHLQRLEQLQDRPEARADEERRALKRVKYAATAWDDLPLPARSAALEAIQATVESPVPGAVHFRASRAPARATKRQAFDAGQRYAASRADLVSLVRVPAGYGRGVNWFFTAPGSGSLRILTDEADALPEPPDPKSDGGWCDAPPPPGAPTGPDWGWCWSLLPPSQPQASEPAGPATTVEEAAAAGDPIPGPLRNAEAN